MSGDIVLLIAGAMLAGFVQGISGFAFGMVAMSIWVWGLEPGLAAVMAVFGGLSGQVFTALTVRRSLQWPTLWPFLAGAVLGVPLGVALLPHLDAALFKRVLGGMLVIFCPAMLLSDRIPHIRAGGRVADALVGALGGVMGGIGGFTGVAPSLWCTLRGLDKDLQRTVIQNFNLLALSASMAALVVAGAVRADMLPLFAIVLPALMLPSLLGARVYKGLSPLGFRRVVLALLSCAGVAMIAASLPRGLA